MQPSIWIGDTVATMDMTPHDIGMVNKHAAKESVSIIMGNKQVESQLQLVTYQVSFATTKECRLYRP